MIIDCINNSIDNYGRNVIIIDPEDSKNKVNTKAFIQPLRYKDKTYMGGKFKDIGQIKGAGYLYIGSRDVRLDKYPLNTIIQADEDKFVLKRAEKVHFKNDVYYIWAILQLYVEED